MSFVAMFLISPVAAATSEGLEWGVAEDDSFIYRFNVVEEGEEILDEIVNATVDAAPGTIPDPLTDWLLIPSVSLDLAYINGSDVGSEGMYLFGIFVAGGHFCIPIGNFSLLTDLFMDSLLWTENHTIINESTNWGARYQAVDAEMNMDVSVRYKTSDGCLNRYSLEVTNTTDGVSSSATFVRQAAGGGIDIVGLLQDNILYVGIGVAVIVILGAVVCMRRK
jgi:hypothetical protein